MLGGFRSPGTQREGGRAEEMMVGAQNRKHGLKGEEGAKSESQGMRVSENKEVNKSMRGCRMRVRECEINRDGKNLKRSLASRLLPS